MNLTEELHLQLNGLSPDLQAEVLDFVKFLKQRHAPSVQTALPAFAPTTLEEVKGCLSYHGPVRTVEEMDAGISEMLRQEWRT